MSNNQFQIVKFNVLKNSFCQPYVGTCLKLEYGILVSDYVYVKPMEVYPVLKIKETSESIILDEKPKGEYQAYIIKELQNKDLNKTKLKELKELKRFLKQEMKKEKKFCFVKTKKNKKVIY